jgi:hypothetical protein
MNLTRVYDFLHVVHVKRRLSTKDNYFLLVFNLLQKQKLNHNIYSE